MQYCFNVFYQPDLVFDEWTLENIEWEKTEDGGFYGCDDFGPDEVDGGDEDYEYYGNFRIKPDGTLTIDGAVVKGVYRKGREYEPIEDWKKLFNIPVEESHKCRGRMIRESRLHRGRVLREEENSFVAWEDPRTLGDFIEELEDLRHHSKNLTQKQYTLMIELTDFLKKLSKKMKG